MRRVSYGPPEGSYDHAQMALDFNPAPPVPKYRVIPVGGRFGVGRSIEGLLNSYDLVGDHALELTAAREVSKLNFNQG